MTSLGRRDLASMRPVNFWDAKLEMFSKIAAASGEHVREGISSSHEGGNPNGE